MLSESDKKLIREMIAEDISDGVRLGLARGQLDALCRQAASWEIPDRDDLVRLFAARRSHFEKYASQSDT